MTWSKLNRLQIQQYRFQFRFVSFMHARKQAVIELIACFFWVRSTVGHGPKSSQREVGQRMRAV
jgi:hypothetical protein